MRTFTAYAITACCLFAFVFARAQDVHVTVIESFQTGQSWEVQDSLWWKTAIDLGYTASVVPQSTLDDNAFYSTTDILVISSAIESWGSANEDLRYPIILDYIMQGKAIYIQSEYEAYYPGNRLWVAMMDSIDGAFQWTGNVNGQLNPMNVIGTIGSMPNIVSEVGEYNYGQSGIGDVEYFLEYQGDYFGFFYEDLANGYGKMLTQSDQDWVWRDSNPSLMQNILFRLSGGIGAGVHEIENNSLNVYPNPASDRIYFHTAFKSAMTLNFIVTDQFGRQLANVPLQANQDLFELEISSLPSGMYFLHAESGDNSYVTKFLKE